MDKKTRPIYMYVGPLRDHLSSTYRLKVKGWKKISHENGKEIKTCGAVLNI